MSAPSDDLSDFVNYPTKPRKPGRKFTLIELLVVLGLIGVLIMMFSPVRGIPREPARRAQCINNLKQIALALHNYESVCGALPPAYTVDPTGKPLHSWRTLILPYLEQQALYERIDLSKPWNDPANAKAYATAIPAYICPSGTPPATNTTYQAVVAPDGCFSPGRSRRFSEITDDFGYTLMVIEAPTNRAVHWMSPIDFDEPSLMGIGPKTGLDHRGGMDAAFVDGSVRFLRTSTSAAGRRAMISIAGNDSPDARAVP